jgi:branched-chain amino acid transport system ATP-binding protein
MSTLLEVHDVKVHFGGVKAVDGISMDLAEGKLFGLVGPNGSGKSTLLAALSRMTDLTSGSLRLAGHSYERETAQWVSRRGLGRTFQTVRLLPSLSVLENVMVGADSRLYGQRIVSNWVMPWRTRQRERECRRAAVSAVERLELVELMDAPAGALPYGTQRRVEIARILAAAPKLVLFDEPTAGMSYEERDAIGKVMRQLQAEGITQVLVEHDMQMISDVCDHVFVMNFGVVIAEGDAETVVQDSAVQEAYLGRRGDGDAAAGSH